MKRILLYIAIYVFGYSAQAQVEPLRKQLQDILQPIQGDVGIAIKILEENDTLTVNGSKHFPMQSVFKLQLSMMMLHQVDQGKFKLEQEIGLTRSEYFPTHSPLAKRYPEGNPHVTLKEIIQETIGMSDNVGCDVLFRLVGGPKKVEQYVHQLGIKNMAIQHTEREMHSHWNIPFKNWSTPFAMLQLLEVLKEGNKLSATSYDLLWNAMAESPTGPKRIRAGLPAGTVFAHKTGTGARNEEGVLGALNDAGIIVLPDGRHLALVIFITNSLQTDEQLEGVLAAIARVVYEHYIY